MNLPVISIPAVNIPFDIPTLMHPPLVHFAVAIPVLIVIFELFNLFLQNKTIKVITSLFMLLLVGIFFGAYITGTADGKAAIDNGFGAMSELKEHKLIGIYIFYASIGMLLLKLISLLVNKTGFKIFYFLIVLGFTAAVLHQAKEGGELVYKYGANVKAQADEFDDDEEAESKPAVKEASKEDKKSDSKAEAKEEPKVQKEQKQEETKATKEKAKPTPAVKEMVKETEEKAKEIVEEKKESILDKAKQEIEKVEEKATKHIEAAKEEVNEALDLNKSEH